MTTTTDSSNSLIILLDNNVLQKILSKKTASLLEPMLKDFENAKVELAVSQIVIFEALKAIVFDENKWKPVVEFIGKYLKQYEVDRQVLVQAARVHEIYGSNPANSGHRASISTEDIIIGTTAMLLGAYILTCDVNDFPTPFFREVNRELFFYKDNNRQKYFVLYLLEPDAKVIDAALQDILKPKNSPKN